MVGVTGLRDGSAPGAGPASAAAATAGVELDVSALGVRGVNARLRELAPGTVVTVRNPAGRHSLAVGLDAEISVTIDGPAGYYLSGLGQHAAITVRGPAGWGVAENLMSGSVRVRGDASQAAAASAHGGLIVVEGNASLRAGTILIGGDAGDGLGDSLYEAVIYVAGTVRGLGSDARVEDLGEADVAAVRDLVNRTGFGHIDPETVTRVGSARQLYHFDTHNHGSY